MNRKILAVLLLLALISVSQAAFAGVPVTPNCSCRTPAYCNIPRPVREELKCGSCTNEWSNECRTLYRITYYSNCTHSTSPVRVSPVSAGEYCYRGSFQKIRWGNDRRVCKTNPINGRIQSYLVQDAILPPEFRWSKQRSWKNYDCPYGCDYSTGTCRKKLEYIYKCEGNVRVKIDKICGNVVERKDCSKYGQICESGLCITPPAPKFKWICSADGKYRYWYDYVNDKRYHRVLCRQGTTCVNGQCVKVPSFAPPYEPCRPRYHYKCELRGGVAYSVKYQEGYNNEIKATPCPYGCDAISYQCRDKPTPQRRVFLKKTETYCKDEKNIYKRFIYTDGTVRVQPYTECGTCQICREGRDGAYCSGPSSGYCRTIRFRITKTGSSSQPVQRTYTWQEIRTGYGTGTASASAQYGGSTYGNSGTAYGTASESGGTASFSAGYSYGAGIRAGSTYSYGPGTAPASTAPARTPSDYGSVYRRGNRSGWVCDGANAKIYVDMFGNKVRESRKVCDYGCNPNTNGCNDAMPWCTNNSDCPTGYRCDRSGAVNECVRRS